MVSTVIISGLNNYTINLHFLTESFDETTISELKRALQVRTGIELDHQFLMYGSKELETILNGRKATFRDYHIRDGINIPLVIRSPGSSRPPGFAGLSFKEVNLYTEGPEWWTIPPGMSFRGTCKNFLCQARNQSVNIQKGFYDSTGGLSILNPEIAMLKCPVCEQSLDKNEVNEIGVFNAKLEIKSKVRGSSEVVVNIEARDEYLHASCMDGRDEVDYDYVVLIVKRL